MAIARILRFSLISNIILILSAVPADIYVPRMYDSLSYQIDLHLPHKLFNSDSTEFTGKTTIFFTLAKQSNYIQLHSRRTSIKFTRIIFNNSTVPNDHYYHNTDTDIVVLYLGLSRSGLHKLVLEYTGDITTGDSAKGLYRSSYVNRDGITKYLLATQFTPSYARTVFPCLDEPQFRATFNISITFPASLNAISNAEEESKVTKYGISTVVFKRTPRMSPHLIAFIISDLTCTSGIIGDRSPFRVCSRDEFVGYRNMALKTAPRLLASYNNFTKFNYSRAIGKLDIVAFPDSCNIEKPLMQVQGRPLDAVEFVPHNQHDLTENWGLMIHNERELLYDNVDTSNQEQTVALTISQELATHWFGNLITFNWWNDIFINKGVAAFLETYITSEVFPKWKVEKQFVVNHLHPTLVHDAMYRIGPLHVNDDIFPVQIEGFNELSYNKGSSIMRMVQHIMGKDRFMYGIQNYINQHKFDTVDVKHLWMSLGTTIDNSISLMPDGLATVMQSWIDDRSYPVLFVKFRDGVVTISQSKFIYSPSSTDAKYGQPTWYIPITYTTSANISQFQKTTPDIWLVPNSTLNIPQNCSWIILNNQQTGYYRVHYHRELMNTIKLVLREDNFGGIPEINRAQLVDDHFNFASADLITYYDVLDFVRFLHNDTSYYPWKAAIEGFGFVIRRLGESTVGGQATMGDMLKLMQNLYLSVPLSTVKEYDQVYTLKQQLAHEWACSLDDSQCITDVVELFSQYRSNRTRSKPNLRYIVYCNGLRQSNDKADWDFLWDAYSKSEPSEQKDILSALGCSQDETLIKKYLQHSITEECGVKLLDVMLILSQTKNNQAAIKVLFEFLVDNQKYIMEKYGSTATLEYVFRGIGERIDDLDILRDKRGPNLQTEFEQLVNRSIHAGHLLHLWVIKYEENIKTYYTAEYDRANYIFLGKITAAIFGILLIVVLIIIALFNGKRIWNFFSKYSSCSGGRNQDPTNCLGRKCNCSSCKCSSCNCPSCNCSSSNCSLCNCSPCDCLSSISELFRRRNQEPEEAIELVVQRRIQDPAESSERKDGPSDRDVAECGNLPAPQSSQEPAEIVEVEDGRSDQDTGEYVDLPVPERNEEPAEDKKMKDRRKDQDSDDRIELDNRQKGRVSEEYLGLKHRRINQEYASSIDNQRRNIVPGEDIHSGNEREHLEPAKHLKIENQDPGHDMESENRRSNQERVQNVLEHNTGTQSSGEEIELEKRLRNKKPEKDIEMENQQGNQELAEHIEIDSGRRDQDPKADIQLENRRRNQKLVHNIEIDDIRRNQNRKEEIELEGRLSNQQPEQIIQTGDLRRSQDAEECKDLEIRRRNQEAADDVEMKKRGKNQDREEDVVMDNRRGNQEPAKEIEVDNRLGEQALAEVIDIEGQQRNQEPREDIESENDRLNLAAGEAVDQEPPDCVDIEVEGKEEAVHVFK